MAKSIISTAHAPAAIGPYSQAVRVGDFLFVSGQIALDPATGMVVERDVSAQAERVMRNIKAIVEAAGSSMSNVAKCTIYLRSMEDFGKVNEVYAGFFQAAPPARATVAVSGLPKDVLIEVDAIAS
jgi:2-iminobutanoate/2-iminopropanoate deaminase